MSRTGKEPLVTIIIVNYNGYEDTRECVTSIQDINYGNCQVLVVDNGSVDGSLGRLAAEFRSVDLVDAGGNLGYTGGNNLGIERALEAGARYIFILNNDTVVEPDVVSVLVDYMEQHPDAGMVGPLVLDYDNPDIVSFAGADVDRNTGLKKFYHNGELRSLLPDGTIDCSFLQGCALFVRAEVFQEVGGFNDMYFLTSEETELCVAVKDHGYRIAVVTATSIRHKVSKTMRAGSVLWGYFLFRNKLYFVRRNARDMRLSDRLAILKYYVVCLLSLLFKKGNLTAVAGLILGVLGYLRNETGKGRYEGKI